MSPAGSRSEMNNASVFLLPAEFKHNSSNLNDSIFRFYITCRNSPLQPGNDRHKLVLGIYLNKLHRLVTFVSLHQAYSLRI